jgi:hypothetical protein
LSQLQSFFQNLSEKEMETLNSMRLIGKEKVVFDYTKRYRSSGFPEIPEVVRALAISDVHYYKINSVLLRKCYEQMIPGQGVKLLHFLRQKNLFSLLRHEILFQDKKHATSLSKEEREKFYLCCFHYLIDLPYKFYDKKLISIFGKKYLDSKVKSTGSDELYVKFHMLFADINRNAARKNPGKSLGITLDGLQKHESELKGSKHYLATYYLYRSLCSYYSYYDKQPEKVIEYLKKAMQLKDKIAAFFPIDISLFLDLLYADALFSNNQVQEAEEIYNRTFKTGVDETMFGYYYHCEQYVLVSIIREKFEQANTLLDEVFQPCINNRLDIYATRGAMCYVKFYLSQADLKNALNYLNLAKVINEKTFYLPFEVQLRVLENIYFFIKKDYDFSLQLAARNIKFLKAQEQTDIFENHLLLWKTISAMITCITKKTPINKELAEDYKFLNHQYTSLYCGLLEKVYEQTVRELK